MSLGYLLQRLIKVLLSTTEKAPGIGEIRIGTRVSRQNRMLMGKCF